MTKLLTIKLLLYMGLGKRFKKFTGAIGQATGQLTGSKTIGRGTAMVAGAALGSLGGVPGAITGAIGGNAGYSDIGKEITNKSQFFKFKNREPIITLNKQLAEQTRLKLLAEADLQRQVEEEKKKTTFAGATMQGISERRKLLGV